MAHRIFVRPHSSIEPGRDCAGLARFVGPVQIPGVWGSSSLYACRKCGELLAVGSPRGEESRNARFLFALVMPTIVPVGKPAEVIEEGPDSDG